MVQHLQDGVNLVLTIALGNTFMLVVIIITLIYMVFRSYNDGYDQGWNDGYLDALDDGDEADRQYHEARELNEQYNSRVVDDAETR